MTAVGDRLRRESPYGLSLQKADPPTPCPGDLDRPAWLWEGHHCRLDKRLRRTYGIGCGDYHRLLNAQGGVCGLCGGRPRRWRLVVDHDHDPPYEVRGLLHFTCNRLLGFLPGLLWWLYKAARYLEMPPGRPLGLRVPAHKALALERLARAKRTRARTRRTSRRPNSASSGP